MYPIDLLEISIYSGSGQRSASETMKHFLYFFYSRVLLEIAIQCRVNSCEHQVQDTCEFSIQIRRHDSYC